jgi:hypothetical protein
MNEAKQLGKVLKTLKETAANAGTSEGRADLQVLAIINPLTRVAQRISQVSDLVLTPLTSALLSPIISEESIVQLFLRIATYGAAFI